MKIVKIGTINNGIDGLEHYFSVIPAEGDSKEQTYDKLVARYWYTSSNLPGSKFISGTYMIDAAEGQYIFVLKERYDV